MLSCEGYKMFYGIATVRPANPLISRTVHMGTWLYKPEYDCWYVNGQSFPAKIVSDFHEVNPSGGPAEYAEEYDEGAVLDRLLAQMEAQGGRESIGC